MTEVARDPNDVAAYDESLAKSYVGPPPELQSKIEVADYDPEWPRLYEREAARIREVLGVRVVRLEHAGSTSVAGLPAKPIIDIVLEVADSSDEAVVRARPRGRGLRPRDSRTGMVRAPGLQGAGHEHQPPRVLGRLRRDGPDGAVSRLAPRVRRRPGTLRGRAKRELAARDWKYVQQYADAKTAIVEEIMSRAEAARQGGEL